MATQTVNDGDAAMVAFTALIDQHGPRIFGYLVRMLGGDHALAEDLTQETFCRAWRARGRFDGANPGGWFGRIATCLALDVLRHRSRFRWLPWDAERHERLLTAAPPEEPEARALAGERAALVQAALDGMTPRYRAALLLREVDEVPCAEIAATLGCSYSGAKAILHRARIEFCRVYTALERGRGETA